jgi:hypothetical protein
MKIEMVVETSAHSINGRHVRSDRGDLTINPWYPCGQISLQKPCRSELAFDKGIHVQSDRRSLQRKALIVVARSHSW